MDPLAAQLSTGISQIRVFNISNITSGSIYDYPSQGKLLGWGLRNSVGVAEEPTTGNVYSVENSADQIQRDGTDIHQDNPGEEMNFHGTLADDDTKGNHGGNFGYPDCFALWGTNGVPNAGSLKVGNQFSLQQSNTLNDSVCNTDRVAPRLTFQVRANSKQALCSLALCLFGGRLPAAELDRQPHNRHIPPSRHQIRLDGSLAFVTFHGSWNRDKPVGYKLSVLSFGNGEPTEPTDSTTAARDILSNPDLSRCPDNCFRPVGLAIDGQGRIFMSSDATGELYVLRQAEVTIQGTGTSAATGTLVTSTSSTSTNAAVGGFNVPRQQEWLLIGLTLALSIVGGAFFAVA